MRPSAAILSSRAASLLYRWKTAVTVLVVVSFSFHFCRYDDRVAMSEWKKSSRESSLQRLPLFCRTHDGQVVCVNKLPGNCDRQDMSVDVKKEGARTDPCGTPFFRRRNLLCAPLPVVRVKLRLRTSSIIKERICLSGSVRKSLQVRPRCHTVS